ncbi:MAG: LysR family transcriptional regulator [Myxococcota bacterium]
MNWDDLRFFLAVARHRTLTAAAKQLGVNHTTVSRRLQSLHDEVGVRLFDKQPEGYFPTNAGEDLLRVAERMESELHSLDRRLLGRDSRLSGKLRVTTLDILAYVHAPDFTRFTERYPEVELEITVDNNTLSLSRREADVAIRVTNGPPDHLVGRKVGTWNYTLFAHRDLAEKYGSDIAAYPWLAWERNLGARITEAWMKRHVPKARIAFYVDAATTMLSGILRGAGVQFLPTNVGRAHDQLQALVNAPDNFNMDVWLLTHADLRRTARVRAFMDYMGDVLVDELKCDAAS